MFAVVFFPENPGSWGFVRQHFQLTCLVIILMFKFRILKMQ